MYLVCYPQGGFNDMMSRIWYCYTYCITFGRTLIIDTTKNWFNDDLSVYLTFTFPSHYKKDATSEFITSLYKETVFPKELKEMDNDHFPKIIWKAPGHMETDTGILVSSRLNRVYDETVLVYADCGSIAHITNILSFTIFTPMVLDEVKKRREMLPKEYTSVHIRNTDYKSNLDDFLTSHDSIFKQSPLFVATDHAPTLELMKSKYQVYSFSSIPIVDEGKNIHESQQSQSLRTTLLETRTFNLDIMCDFLILALGNEYYFSQRDSGFSRSVYFLHGHKTLVHFLTKL